MNLDERIVSVTNDDPSTTKVVLPYEHLEPATEDQIVSLVRGLRQNTHVQILDLHFTPSGLRHNVCHLLLPALFQENSSIHFVHFPRRMTNAEFLPSAEVLCNNGSNTTVNTLGLNGCDICGHEGGEIVAQLMRNNHYITTIYLCDILNFGPTGATRIAAALGDDGCALKMLDLNGTRIGSEGTAAFCAALRVNNCLEKIILHDTGITEEGYLALASSLPHMRGLKDIAFRWETWEPHQYKVPATRVQRMMEGLRANDSLRRISVNCYNLSREHQKQWKTCCEFVCVKNKMNSHLLDETICCPPRTPGTLQAGAPLGWLLHWCHQQGNAEVQASLVYSVVSSRSEEIAGLANVGSRVSRFLESVGFSSQSASRVSRFLESVGSRVRWLSMWARLFGLPVGSRVGGVLFVSCLVLVSAVLWAWE